MTIHKNRNEAQGFTLFGFLLYIALSSVLLIAVSDLTITVLVANVRAQDEQTAVYTLSFLNAKLGEDIGSADSVLAPTPGAPSTELELEQSGDTVRYFVSDERLWVTRNSESPEPLTPSDVLFRSSEFSISTGDKGVVQWKVRIGTRNPLRTEDIRTHATTTFTWYPYVYE